MKSIRQIISIIGCVTLLSACVFSSIDMQQPANQLHRTLAGKARMKQNSQHIVIYLSADTTFYPGTSRLTPQAMRTLIQVINTMHAYPALHVKIAGYTDDHIKPKTSQLVSLRRAMVVADYFRNHNIDSGRIEMSGLGAANPIADNATAQGRAQNRRVELTLFAP